MVKFGTNISKALWSLDGGCERYSETQWLCLVKVKFKLQSVDVVHLFDEKLQVILFDVEMFKFHFH